MRILSLVLIALIFATHSSAHALTRTEHVTNKYALANPGLISVKAVEKEEGMVSFTIDFKHKKARYVVAHMKVSDALRTLSESHTPMFTVTENSKYFFSVPREHIRTSKYSLSVSGVTRERNEKEPLPWSRHYKTSFKPLEETMELTPNVGSVVYEICLSDFVSSSEPNDSCTHELLLPSNVK